METFTLDNGLRCVVVQNKDIAHVGITIKFRAGADYEESMHDAGVAHYLEHVLFQGTDKYPTAKDVHDVVHMNGAFANGTTGHEEVNYWITVLNEDIPLGFDYLEQLILHPLITEEAVEHERAIITQELKGKLSNPEFIAYMKLKEHLYPQQRLATSVIGTLESLPNIKRQSLLAFKERGYTGSNGMLTVWGNVDFEHIQTYAHHAFGTLPRGKEFPVLKAKEKQSYETVVHTHADHHHADLSVCFPIFSETDPRFYSLQVASTILGGNSSSRLHQTLREEKRYVYSTSSGTHHDGLNGMWLVEASCAEENLPDVMEIMKTELLRLRAEPVTEEELLAVKKKKFSARASAMFSPSSQAVFHTNRLFEKWDETSEQEIIDRFVSVTTKDIQNVVGDILATPPKVGLLAPTITQESFTTPWDTAR